MITLRLTQSSVGPDEYRVEVALEGNGLPRQTATARFAFALSDQDREDLRWYLEDYLQYPFDPAPTIAARLEYRLAKVGTDLFRALFHADDDARDLWATLRTRLNDTRVEIVTEVREATASLPPDVVAAAQERGRELDWWETAEALLEELPGHWDTEAPS